MSEDSAADRLIQRYFLDVVQGAELDELDRLLRTDGEAADAFAEAAWTDALLRAEFAREVQAAGLELPAAASAGPLRLHAWQILDQAETSAPLAEPRLSDPPLWAFNAFGKAVRGIARLGVPGYLVAVSLVFLVCLALQALLLNKAPEKPYVAYVSKTFHARWADEGISPEAGSGLTAGQLLKLKSGFVAIRFKNEAQVLLQGPATFMPQDRAAGQLVQGKLVGRVETPKARGFAIHSPTATLVDRGTEFGVAVDSDGRTEVFVFAGDVEMRAAREGQPNAESQHLKAGQAARVDLETKQVVTSRPRPAIFVRTIPGAMAMYSHVVRATRPDRLWAYCRLDETSVSSSGDPTYAENAVPAGDPCIAMWGNLDRRTAPVCGVPGPTPDDGFAGFLPGNRAAEFLGSSRTGRASLLQLGSVPFHSPNAADRKLDAESQTMAFFIKTSHDAPDSRLFVAHPANQHDFQIVMSNGRLGITTRDGSADQTVMTTETYNDDCWHHVVVVRNGDDAGKARLYVDGEPVPLMRVRQAFQAGATSAFGAGRGNSTEWVGSLDEIAIWNSSLNDAEIIALYLAAMGVAEPPWQPPAEAAAPAGPP